MRTLITGGNGDIAQAIADNLDGEVFAPDKNILDVSNVLSINKYIGKIKPDLVINCAGYIKPDSVKTSNPTEWIKQINVNLVGTYLVTREALNKGATTVINIASTSGMGGRPEWSAYCASKAGVISLTQSLAEEGVNAYCISPHRTLTKMRKELFPNEDEKTLMHPDRIVDIVKDIIDNKYEPGVNVEVDKDETKIHQVK